MTTHGLYELQELDWEIDRSQSRLTSVEYQIEDDSALGHLRGEIEFHQSARGDLQSEQSIQELELQVIEDRVKDLDSKLYSGTVKTTREMESGLNELQAAREQVRGAEEHLFSIMVKLDEMEKNLAVSGERLTGLEAERGKSLVTLDEERTTLLKQLEDLEKDRKEMVSDTDSGHLARYEMIRQAREGYAVARVERGMCQGCRLTLTTHEMQKLRSGDEPIHCNSCGRILYLS